MLSTLLLAAAASAPSDVFTERLIAVIPDEVPVYDATSGNNDAREHRCAWSADGEHVAWIATADGAPHAALDGELLAAFDELEAPVFAPVGPHYAFRGEPVGASGWAVLLDGEVVREADRIGPLAFAPDGDRLAFWEVDGSDGVLACLDASSGEAWRTGRGVPVDPVTLGLPHFDAKGRRAIASAKGDDEYVLVLASRSGAKVVETAAGWITAAQLHPKGREFAYVVQDLNHTPSRMFTVRGSERLATSMDQGGFGRYSPDGRHFAYLVRREGKAGVAIDSDVNSKPIYYGVTEIVWDEQGERIAFVANLDGPSLVTADGEQYEEGGGMWFVVNRSIRSKAGERGPGFVEVGALVFSPAGDHVAYRARRGLRWVAVVDDRVSEVYDEVGPPVFSSDGSRIAFGARKGRELLWRVMEVGP